MILSGNEGKETQNLERERTHQEMEMKMKFDDRIHKNTSEIERGVVKKEGEKGEESENEAEEINGGYNKDMPPVDDVCPICFDGLTIPCRSNCGHWFCASCFIQFWTYKSSIRPCKCPLCCCSILNLKPEMSQFTATEDNAVNVLKKLQHYNSLHVGGLQGTLKKILALPICMRRIFRVLIDPDGVRCAFYVTRLLGVLLAVIYEAWEFEFIPTGGFGIKRMFDMGACVLVTTLFFIGVVHRWMLRLRARRFAALQE